MCIPFAPQHLKGKETFNTRGSEYVLVGKITRGSEYVLGMHTTNIFFKHGIRKTGNLATKIRIQSPS